ncbi:GNAT family N-acetyltransferase [Maricaulis sp. CAU 1757]
MGPVLETERLTLRLPELDDAAELARHLGDYDIARMTARVPHPYPALAAELWVLANRAAWRADGNQSLLVFDAEGLAGGGGVFRRTPQSEWEIGYWVAKRCWGRGYATELGQALIGLAREQLGANRIIAGHNEDNPASGRVLEKLGFRYTGESRSWCMARLAQVRTLDMTLAPDLV